jgi:hypothetical protein
MTSLLFQCPDCGKDVSRKARVCPHCGNKKIKSQIKQKEWENMDPVKKKRVIIGAVVTVLALFIGGIFGELNKPDPCECWRILDVPTQKVGVGMPLPVEHLSNEDFRKYEKCHETYAGPAGALLECGKQ